MPSSVSFLLHRNSNSLPENDNNNMSEHLSDHDDSDNQTDDTYNQESNILTQQIVELDDNWTIKSSRDRSKFTKLSNQGEATLLEIEPNQTSFVYSNRQQITSPEKRRSVNMGDNNPQLHDIHIFSPDEFDADTQNVYSIPKTKNTQQSSSLNRTKTKIIQSPIRTSILPTNVEARRSSSKNLIRSNSLSQSQSRIPVQTKNKRQIPSSITNKGVFHFFTTDDQQKEKRNTSLLKDNRKRITSSDDDEDIKTYNDLKLKLKEEKRHGKKTGELFNKLHENYEELLEKYAQAENTIDQLRFQPKIFGDNTPTSTTSEHQIHFTEQSKVNLATLRSSGVYRSTTGSPISSIRPVPSTTPTTPARKSISPENSGTTESVYFYEVTPEKTVVEEIIIPETLKLDLLLGAKSLEDKMKSFLTLMETNHLSLAEQKQVYESIRQDYEKLRISYEQNRHHLNLDADLNKELETMKQLLQEIVKKITQNLLGKSPVNSSSDRQTHDESHSSRLSVQSSLCNHNDLMDQYKKLLDTVNTNRASPVDSLNNELEIDSKFNHQKPINNKQKPYIYISGDSDDEQQQINGIKPIPYTRGFESTSFELDYIPSTTVKHHQHKIEGQPHNLKSKQKKIRTDSSLLIPTRYSNSRTNDYDSGIGIHNLTKLSYDSKLYTNTMDESHFQSLDDEQESISSSSSSHSSDSGSESPGNPYSKKFDNRSSYRRKPIGQSNSYQTDIPPQSSSYKKRMNQSSHTWKPQKTSSSHRSRLKPIHRSSSIASPSIEDFQIKSLRPLTTPEISSKIKTKHRQIIPPTYRSSIYINEAHTNKGLYDKIDENLYLDRQTGIIYRNESNKTDNRTRNYYGPSSQTKLYRCAECGTVTTYHHRHHIESSPSRRARTPSDDLGYESGYKKRNRRYRYIDYSSSSSSSDSDSDISSNYLELSELNQAYNRVEQIQYHSRCLSRYIVRQIKLSLATL